MLRIKYENYENLIINRGIVGVIWGFTAASAENGG